MGIVQLPRYIEIQNKYSDCLGNEGITTDNYPYQVDPDGTIRANLVETDGSLIRKDFILITGGPAPEGETVSKVDVKPTANDLSGRASVKSGIGCEVLP